MNFRGKLLLLFIYNKQSRPLIRGLLKEPSDLGLHCLQMFINSFPALQGVNIDGSNLYMYYQIPSHFIKLVNIIYVCLYIETYLIPQPEVCCPFHAKLLEVSTYLTYVS